MAISRNLFGPTNSEQERRTTMVELNKGNRTKDEEIRTLSSEVVDLEDLVKKQKRIINQAEERTKEDAVLLRKANDEIAGLKNNLLLSTEANGILKGEMVDLEMALLKKEEECKSLEKLSHSQMIRLVELQARLGRFESQTWGYRVLKAASSLAQLPVTVMEAITFPNVEEKCPPRRTKL
ncbi:hypothetical protein AAG570_003365 [Ranatra chinensis]|uniref:Uncharacterized protein n=1 Tax=Ranatra chinensis TaxID=642074 RepID=A0ABD0YHW0_9HEMI